MLNDIMLKRFYYTIPAVMGAALLAGGIAILVNGSKLGEAIFMMAIGVVFLFAGLRKLWGKNKTKDKGKIEQS